MYIVYRMSISNYAVLLFLLELFTETYGTSCNSNNDWQVATFCSPTQAAGNIVILDGYAVYQDSSEKRCQCTAVVSIPNNGTTSLVFNKLFSYQPNYNGCGSYISVSDSDETVIHRCFIAGTMTVNNQENVNIELVKEFSPEDTRYCMLISVAETAATITVTCDPDANTTTTSTTTAQSPTTTTTTPQSSTTTTTTPQATTSSLTTTSTVPHPSPSTPSTSQSTSPLIESTTSLSTTTKIATEHTSRESTNSPTQITDIEDDVENDKSTVSTSYSTDEATSASPFRTESYSSSQPLVTNATASHTPSTSQTSSSVGPTTSSSPALTSGRTSATIVDEIMTSTLSLINQTTTPYSQQSKMFSTSLHNSSSESSTTTTLALTEMSSSTEKKTSVTTTTTSFPSTSLHNTKQTSIAATNISSTTTTTTVSTSVESSSQQSKTTTTPQSSSKSSQMSSSTKQTSTPQAQPQTQDDDLPIEVIIPVAIVGGLLIITLIICVTIGVRRKGCRWNNERTVSSNNLVDKVSVDIKNREKDTYVNPLYDDISLTGKSDRSDRDSMMQEVHSEDGDSYILPVSTEIDGELWTHL